MSLGNIPLFQLAEQRLAWIDSREQLLARNVANADTPGYLPQDLLPFAAGLARAQTQLETTNPLHLHPPGLSVGVPQQSAGERAPDGNAVSLDDQLTRIAETETAHDLTADLYQKYMSLFRVAIGR
jgi:flagellar basal-body rod protein FlgB